MKTKYLILSAIIIAFSSCSTAYQTGQTPDDVYYSPAPPVETEYVVLNNPEEREIRSQMNSLRYRNNLSLSFNYGYGYGNPMGYGFIGSRWDNPFMYGIYDPYGYGYMPYFTNPYYVYGNSYNPYNKWGGYYPYDNYYYTPVTQNSGPRKVNLGVYGNNAPLNPRPQTVRGSDGRTYTPTQVPIREFTPTTPQSESQPQRSTKVGSFIRKVFTPSTERPNSNSTPNRTFENNRGENNRRENNPPPPVREFTPPPSAPPSSSGSAPVRTFRKD
ncbi:MAG: hypothetical protein ABI208_10410 [Ginsengibacter sp.]|jgi:hypothetical protein